jgi:hypothetical protein
MRKMRVFIVAVLIITGAFSIEKCFGQSSMIVYTDNVIGFRSSQNRLIGGELKVFLNSPGAHVEFSGLMNFKKNTYHQFSAGLGLNLNANPEYYFFNGIVMPLNLTLFPFQDSKNGFLRQFSLIAELTPGFYPEGYQDGGQWQIRRLLGIRFNFDK